MSSLHWFASSFGRRSHERPFIKALLMRYGVTNELYLTCFMPKSATVNTMEDELIKGILEARQKGANPTRICDKDTPKVLIVGGSGYVGKYLCRDLPKRLPNFEVYATYGKNTILKDNSATFSGLKGVFEVELTGDYSSIIGVISSLKPDFIINTAAMSAVADCQNRPDEAFAINDPSKWAKAAVENGCKRFIHFSTDMVYHGDAGPYSETSEAKPIESMVYGVSKRKGEIALLDTVDATIVRSALIIGGPPVTGTGRGSTLEWMKNAIAAATPEQPAKFFSNEMRSPVLVDDIVFLLATILDKDVKGTDIPVRLILNMGGASHCSRLEIGEGLATRMGISTTLIKPVLQEPIMGGIERPRDIRMTITRIEQIVGVQMSTLDESLDFIFGIKPLKHPLP